MIFHVFLFIVALSAMAGPILAASNPLRVLDESPRDARLGPGHDLDHPWGFHPEYRTAADWEKRSHQLREQVQVAEGLWPLPPRCPLDAVVHGRIERDGYTIERVFFRSLPGHYVSGSLYRPTHRSGKSPGVLCPHGHWQNGRFYENSDEGVRDEVASGGEKTLEGARYPLQARCAMLARMGCVVFHYDMVGDADSTAIPHGAGFEDVDAVLRLQSSMGLQTWNSIRALDFLCSLPDVDRRRLAVTGASGGGTQTILLCAVDRRPAVAFPAVMVSTEMQGGCVCENAPLLRVGTNNVEIAALFAPKPLGMTGANDWTRQIETHGLPELKSIYGLYGKEAEVNAWYRSFPHNYNQVSRELMYNWLDGHLGLGLPQPVVEMPFQPAAPAALSVYDAEHPVPADAADAATLRRTLTAESDAQIAELMHDPAAYRRIVKAALQAMVSDRLPSPDEVDYRRIGSVVRDGYSVEKGVLSRRDSGEAIPVVRLSPPHASGWPVLWVSQAGKAGLFTREGEPNGDVRQLLAAGRTVVAADLFLTGEFLSSNGPPPVAAAVRHLGDSGRAYPGFALGYNRSLLAERVHDLLTAIAFVRGAGGSPSVDLLGSGEAGAWALLAAALAGPAVHRSALELDQFDFDRVRSADDAMMLPGALKYGGIYGFVPLLSGRASLWSARHAGEYGRAEQCAKVRLLGHSARDGERSAWLLSR